VVVKDTLIKVIEYNADKIPMKTLESYLGHRDVKSVSQRAHRREKWLSYGQVMDCLYRLNDDKKHGVYWDDIIDSLMMIPSNNMTTTISSNNTSKVITYRIPQDVKIVLKDQSVLLDFSKLPHSP